MSESISNASLLSHNGSDLALTGIADMMTAMLKKFSNEVNLLISTAITAIRDELASLQKQYTMKLKELTEAVNVVNNRITTTKEELECFARRKELVVFGVPYRQNENLGDYYHRWCNVLGYSRVDAPIAHIRRISSSPRSGTRCPIVIEFALLGQRNLFFARYLRTRTLSLHHTGFTERNRIYITESLSKTTRKLKSAAIKLKAEKKLLKVAIKESLVTITTKNNRHITLFTEEDLRAAINDC